MLNTQDNETGAAAQAKRLNPTTAALVGLLLSWIGRKEEHVRLEAEHIAGEFLKRLPLRVAHDALLVAAKRAVMESCDLESTSLLDIETLTQLNAAIELGGGFSPEEEAHMENLSTLELVDLDTDEAPGQFDRDGSDPESEEDA
jgi:hypothetical protein